jgi:hypothetical protein
LGKVSLECLFVLTLHREEDSQLKDLAYTKALTVRRLVAARLVIDTSRNKWKHTREERLLCLQAGVLGGGIEAGHGHL